MVNWEEIKQIWTTGVGSLEDSAVKNGVSLAQIMLKAREDKWGTRATQVLFDFSDKNMNFDETANAYRKTMLKIKELSDAILANIDYHPSLDTKVAALDTISKVITRIMPLSLSVTDFKDVMDLSDDDIKKLIKEEQMRAMKKGDIKMLMFLGKQHLGQKETMDVFMREITSDMAPQDAAQLYREMLKDND